MKQRPVSIGIGSLAATALAVAAGLEKLGVAAAVVTETSRRFNDAAEDVFSESDREQLAAAEAKRARRALKRGGR